MINLQTITSQTNFISKTFYALVAIIIAGCTSTELSLKKKCENNQVYKDGKCVVSQSACIEGDKEVEACSVLYGIGQKTRTCKNNEWSLYSICSIKKCNEGYEFSNGYCQLVNISTCTEGEIQTQACLILNGSGLQSRTCRNNVWGAYGTCAAISCNSGYELENGRCQMIKISACVQKTQNKESAFGIYGAYSKFSSREFIDNMIKANRFKDESNYNVLISNKMKAIHARSTRISLLFLWPIIQSTINGEYDFSGPFAIDETINEIYKQGNNIDLIAVIAPGIGNDFHNPLSYPTQWKAFVKAVAKRYPNIKYYQLSNEIQDWTSLGDNNLKTPANYAKVAQATINALTEVNSSAKLVIVSETFSSTSVDNSTVAQIITECKKLNISIHAIDIHHYSDEKKSWKMPHLTHFRNFLDKLAYIKTEIWSAEHGAYVGQPSLPSNIQLPPNAPPYETFSEEDQARWMIKSFVYNRFNHLDKILWANIIDVSNFDGNTNSMFNSMGLISDGYIPGSSEYNSSRLGTERISFYTYKMMTDKTDNNQAELVGTVSNVHNDSTIYAYEFRRLSDCSKFYIAWSESGTQNVSIPVDFSSVHITNMIPDRFGITKKEFDKTASGSIQVSLDIDPILIESNSSKETNKCPISSILIAKKDQCLASSGIVSPVFNDNGCISDYTCIEGNGDSSDECTSRDIEVTSCSVQNGTGTQTKACINNEWGASTSCIANSCNSGYELKNNQCTPITSTTVKSSPVYRLSYQNAFFYTIYESEKNNAITLGYAYNGVAFNAYATQAASTVPVYRLTCGIDRMYLPSQEAATQIASTRKCSVDGVAFYASGTLTPDTVPVFALEGKTGNHLYTIYGSEADTAASTYGYIRRGIAFYVPYK